MLSLQKQQQFAEIKMICVHQIIYKCDRSTVDVFFVSADVKQHLPTNDGIKAVGDEVSGNMRPSIAVFTNREHTSPEAKYTHVSLRASVDICPVSLS